MKKIMLLLFLFSTTLTVAFAQNSPGEPDAPVIVSENGNVSRDSYNVAYKRQNGFFYEGQFEGVKSLDLNKLEFEGSSRQRIKFDEIKSIRVVGYTIKKKSFNDDKLSLVFYFPYLFDIELKNGEMINRVKGRINKLEEFSIRYLDKSGTSVNEKCYAYFVRYWLEDQQVFADNNSDDFNETPTVHNETVTFIEFK